MSRLATDIKTKVDTHLVEVSLKIKMLFSNRQYETLEGSKRETDPLAEFLIFLKFQIPEMICNLTKLKRQKFLKYSPLL